MQFPANPKMDRETDIKTHDWVNESRSAHCYTSWIVPLVNGNPGAGQLLLSIGGPLT
jgi:hypothetical protein